MTGCPVVVFKIASGFGMQKSRVRIIAIPVTPPIPTHISMAWGASRVGRGISSCRAPYELETLTQDKLCDQLQRRGHRCRLTVICATASKPMSDKALWSSPRNQATPLGHPVLFVNVVKTNSASVFGDVARMVAAAATKAVIDQNTGLCQQVAISNMVLWV